MKTCPTALSLSPLTTQRIVLTCPAQCPGVQENNLPVIAVLIIFIIICPVRPRYAEVVHRSRSNDIGPVFIGLQSHERLTVIPLPPGQHGPGRTDQLGDLRGRVCALGSRGDSRREADQLRPPGLPALLKLRPELAPPDRLRGNRRPSTPGDHRRCRRVGSCRIERARFLHSARFPGPARRRIPCAAPRPLVLRSAKPSSPRTTTPARREKPSSVTGRPPDSAAPIQLPSPARPGRRHTTS